MITPLYTEEHAYKLIATACEYLKITPSEIIGKCRLREYTTPRHLLWKFMHDNLDYSKRFLGVVFSGRDHSTVMNGIAAATDWIETDIYVSSLYQCLEQHMKDNGYTEPIKPTETVKTYPLSAKQVEGIKQLFATYEQKKKFYLKYGFQDKMLFGMILKRRYSRKLKGRVEKLLKDISVT